MKTDNLMHTPISNSEDAADRVKQLLSSYELPESYQRLINGPWRLVAESIMDHYGHTSDAWGRMTWFTRILCTAIETSLQRQNPESVNDALNGFNIWLNSLREDSDFYSRCLNAANYAQRRISTQITEDTGLEASPVENTQDSCSPAESTAAETAEEVIVIEEEADMTNTTDDTDAPNSSVDSLALSLAYSDSKPVTAQAISDSNDSQSEDETRGIDMDISSPAAVEEAAINQTAGSSQPGNSELTESTAIAPVPMGTWLAFHDQDMPTLARLTIYDPTSDSFMLANKNGILVRQIKKAELLNLVNGGLIQMVEFRSIVQ